jgi:SAM-dependent methyltransferase
MCNKACLDFGDKAITDQDVRGKRILEVGSRDVNGSVREIVGRFAPAEYVGVDIEEGPGVDQVCGVDELVSRFGPESFDAVLSTEMIEHVRDWRSAITQLKTVLRPGGILLITTRSKGFPYHDYPSDYWRFELDDMQRIFSDMSIEALEGDPSEPGVFVKARRPEVFKPNDLSAVNLFSIITGDRVAEVSTFDIMVFKIKKLVRA